MHPLENTIERTQSGQLLDNERSSVSRNQLVLNPIHARHVVGGRGASHYTSIIATLQVNSAAGCATGATWALAC